jgi:hypothetical protein
MFELTAIEFENWRCQFGTSNSTDKMGLRIAPYAFTEQGVAQLSSVLKQSTSYCGQYSNYSAIYANAKNVSDTQRPTNRNGGNKKKK